MDHKQALTDRVIIVTGAGRSGTTILGKIIGSMEPAYYLFEPSIMKFCRDPESLRAVVFEDYFLLQTQGRAGNFRNESDDSYIGNYNTHIPGPVDRESSLRECLQSKLVIKLTEYQPVMNFARTVFPGCQFVHIVRNGNDVVDSACRRGWYTDEWMKTGYLDLLDNDVPWFIDETSKRLWGKWNQETRAACVWRCSTQEGVGDDVLLLKYNDLAETNFDGLAKHLNLKMSDLTRKHIKGIKPPTKHRSVLDKIRQPELGKFLFLMQLIGGTDDKMAA